MTRIRMGVVADDITGANDIGIMFAQSGLETHVYTVQSDGSFAFDPRSSMQPDICILDTNSRLDPPEIAYRKVQAATSLLQEAGCQQFHNKTCSVFRGNIGVEFDAMLDTLKQDFAVVVLGFPKNGRTTVSGVHYVHGTTLAESPFRNDPIHPMTQSSLVEILQAQTKRRVALLDHSLVVRGPEVLRSKIDAERGRGGYVIVDVIDQTALATIARATHDLPVICGSSAIAEELPAAWGLGHDVSSPLNMPPWNHCGILIAAGSLTPQTRAQVEHMRRIGTSTFVLPTSVVIPAEREAIIAQVTESLAREIKAGQNVLLHSPNDEEGIAATRHAGVSAGLAPTEVARAVSDVIAEIVARVLEQTKADRLIVAGGETSGAVCSRLGITGVRVWREIQPGLPSCVTLTEPHRWLVLKSGSFGSADFLDQAIAHLGTVAD